jgi:hypothetical protein
MASSKFYSYYLKGNKIAIIEDNLADNDQLKSPTSTVVSGLEIQYAYSPTYRLGSTGTEGTDFHKFLGWGSDGTNLLLFTFGASDYYDISGVFATDDWIYISGSGRWSGLHQVKSTGAATGILTLKTRCNLRPSKITVDGTFSTTAETFNGDSAAFDMDIEAFKDAQDYRSTPYVFITVENNNVLNKGLFSLTSDTTSGQLTANNRITIDADGDYTSTAANFTTQADDASTFYNAFYEQIFVYEGVEILQDETFELDLSRYQANAIVYYLKAKLAEDTDEMEEREFFMREFKRQLEKGVSALKRGPYIVQGFKEMR